VIGHVFHQRQIATPRKTQALSAQNGCPHTVIARHVPPNLGQFPVPFMASCWQFAITSRPIRFHLNVQYRLIGTSACNAKSLVFAVVDVVVHLHFPESKLFAIVY
jgi:hypothetical protein